VTREKRFAKNYARELMSVSLLDLASAKDLRRAGTKRVENILLLAQQSLEKALKAVLCWNDRPIPFLHDIGILVTLVTAIEPPPFAYTLNELTEFAAIRRYHEGLEEFTSEEIDEILARVEEGVEWCRVQIDGPLP
jgi:HEPN domain-containing protein